MEEDYSAVAFTNISSIDFTWEWNSKPYSVKAGETKYFPIFLAKHLAKHLIDRELGDKLANKDLRAEMEARILSEASIPVEEVEPESIQAKVEEVVNEEAKPFEELKEVKKVRKPRVKKIK